MIVLAIRLEVDLIFRNTYQIFFSKDQHADIASRLINDLITALVDPNLYYSRFSFFESGREAIEIKMQQVKKGLIAAPKKKFMIRSTLMQ